MKWLYEVPNDALQYSLKNLDNAYKNFFKRNANFPKFKSKKNGGLYRNTATHIKIKDNHVQLPKLGKVKFDNHREINGIILNATVNKTSTGKYFVSLCCEVEIEKLPKLENSIGIDLGIKYFATLSNGEKIENPKFFRKYQNKLAKAQRKLSRRKKGGKNREKQRIIVAKIHEKIKNCRNNFLHKLSTKLINENQVIALEDLNVAGMMKYHCLAKTINDISFGEFRRQLTYKANWYGREIRFCDRFEPTTQICNECKVKNELIKGVENLNIRKWKCSSCCIVHDRDINAAKNILNLAKPSARHAELTLDQYLSQWTESSQEARKGKPRCHG